MPWFTLFNSKGKPDLVVSEDEEYKRVDYERFSKLPTAFLVSAPTLLSSVYINSTWIRFVFFSRRKTVLLLLVIRRY